jgi:peroxiredoxin Q/BCP
MKLKEGELAPTFKVQDDQGNQFDLNQAKGSKVVLFFYPKDDTPGCTKESCEFRDLLPEFQKAGAKVYGISADDVESHKSFKSKYALNFPLLADVGHKIATTYDVWGPQEWQGKKYEGIKRTTFVIDEKGKLAKIYTNVNPVGHAEAVLSDIQR